ncbi:MAG: 4Fe-4S dicluster domain-containing protein [Saprospiraceae bacterium]
MGQTQPSYRDKIATVDEHGKRIWIYPKKPKGKFTNARTYVSWVLLLVLFGLPFIKINGEPLVLFNILERNFIIFGLHFTPQDFHLFVLAMLTFLVFIVLFTVVYGRIFCGWVCPQTIFMEMVFRKVEYWIEGDYNAQRRLDKAPWTRDKIVKKTAKQVIFIGISVLIAHTFLSYIVGLDAVREIVTSNPVNNPVGFASMLGFTAAFYFVFARLREQVCTTICPYGRLQGVMTDKNTILITYDFIRGEPRGKKRRQPKPAPVATNPLADIQLAVATANGTTNHTATLEAPPLGDCIDCKLCVKVCPTGIDIRDGVQLECVNCTACIDACDEVMEKIERPTGLIRYDSYNGVVAQKKKLFTPRVIAYTVVLGLLVLANVFLLATRSPVEAVLLRTPGMLYQKVGEDKISNLYNYQIFNKTGEDLPVEWRLVSEGEIKLVGTISTLPANDMIQGAFFVELERKHIAKGKAKLKLEVWAGDRLLEKTTTNFLGPRR